MVQLTNLTDKWPYYFLVIPVCVLAIGGCFWWMRQWYKKNNLNKGVNKKDLDTFTLKRSTWWQSWTRFHYLIPLIFIVTLIFIIVLIILI